MSVGVLIGEQGEMSDRRDGVIGKTIGALGEIGDFLALFIGQDRRNFAVKFHAFNRQISLDGGDFGRRGANGSFVGIGALDCRPHIFPGIMQLREQGLERGFFPA